MLVAGVALALGTAAGAVAGTPVPPRAMTCVAQVEVVDETTGTAVTQQRVPPAEVQPGDELTVTFRFNPEFPLGACVGPIDVVSEPGEQQLAGAFSDGSRIEYTIEVAPDAAPGSDSTIVFSTPRYTLNGTEPVLIGQVMFRIAGGQGGNTTTIEPGPPARQATGSTAKASRPTAPSAAPQPAQTPTTTAAAAEPPAGSTAAAAVDTAALASASKPAGLPVAVWVGIGVAAGLGVIAVAIITTVRAVDRRRRFRRMAGR